VKISTPNGKQQQENKKEEGVNVVVQWYSMVKLPCAQQGDKGTNNVYWRTLKKLTKEMRKMNSSVTMKFRVGM
jgi:broad specificity polyphosphatase/5'/3'-nucleotidase SurE